MYITYHQTNSYYTIINNDNTEKKNPQESANSRGKNSYDIILNLSHWTWIKFLTFLFQNDSCHLTCTQILWTVAKNKVAYYLPSYRSFYLDEKKRSTICRKLKWKKNETAKELCHTFLIVIKTEVERNTRLLKESIPFLWTWLKIAVSWFLPHLRFAQEGEIRKTLCSHKIMEKHKRDHK